MMMMTMMRMIAGALAVCLPSLTYGLRPGEREGGCKGEKSLNMILMVIIIIITRGRGLQLIVLMIMMIVIFNGIK